MLKNIPIVPDLTPIKQQLQNSPSNIFFPPLEICDYYKLHKNSAIFYQHTPQYYNYFKLVPAITKPYTSCTNTKIYIHFQTLISTPQQELQKLLPYTNNILFTYTLNLPIETEIKLIQQLSSLPYNTTIISETHLKLYLNLLPSATINCPKHNYTLYFYYILNNIPDNTCPKLNLTPTN